MTQSKPSTLWRADVIVIRHPMGGAPALAAKHAKAAIVNAGDGMNEHPTQALLDMFTIQEKKGHIDGLKVAILGDIAHSRVARSNIYGLKTMGAQVSVGGSGYVNAPDIEKLGVSVFNSVQEAMIDADVIIGLRSSWSGKRAGCSRPCGNIPGFSAWTTAGCGLQSRTRWYCIPARSTGAWNTPAVSSTENSPASMSR